MKYKILKVAYTYNTKAEFGVYIDVYMYDIENVLNLLDEDLDDLLKKARKEKREDMNKIKNITEKKIKKINERLNRIFEIK